MLLLSPMSKLGSIHIQSCVGFETIEEIQQFLVGINRRLDLFAICPEVYGIVPGCKIEKMDEEYHRLYVYPYTFMSRNSRYNNTTNLITEEEK